MVLFFVVGGIIADVVVVVVVAIMVGVACYSLQKISNSVVLKLEIKLLLTGNAGVCWKGGNSVAHRAEKREVLKSLDKEVGSNHRLLQKPN